MKANASSSYGYENCPEELKLILDKMVEGFRNILQDDLVGIYLHGSLAMGCFNPKSSDIDFLVIVKDKLEVETKRKIIDVILQLSRSKYMPEKDFEFSVILQKYLEPFIYPTPFELHYSKMWKRDYELDKVDYTKQDDDPDLAAHITITLNRGISLYGKLIEEVFHPVPEEYYISSLIYDVEDIPDNITKDPVYGILNMCRVLYYLREKVIFSKDEAAVWALENLPEKFKDPVKQAILLYRGVIDEVEWDKKELVEFSDYMMEKINRVRAALSKS